MTIRVLLENRGMSREWKLDMYRRCVKFFDSIGVQVKTEESKKLVIELKNISEEVNGLIDTDNEDSEQGVRYLMGAVKNISETYKAVGIKSALENAKNDLRKNLDDLGRSY